MNDLAGWARRKAAGTLSDPSSRGLVAVVRNFTSSKGTAFTRNVWVRRDELKPGERVLKGKEREVARTELLTNLSGHAVEHPSGFSFRPLGGGKVPTDGYMVGAFHPNDADSVKVPIDAHTDEQTMRAKIEEHSKKYLDHMLARPDHYFGGWLEKDKQGVPTTFHFEIAKHVKTREEAHAMGVKNNQKAIFDVAAAGRQDWDNAEISTGGTGAKIPGVEKQRGSLIK